jgi:hypothetical protein
MEYVTETFISPLIEKLISRKTDPLQHQLNKMQEEISRIHEETSAIIGDLNDRPKPPGTI